MKQTGKRHSSPGAPPFGNGGTRMKATMLKTMMPPMRRNQRDDSPRRDRWGGVSATWGGATCSLDTLAPHTGARLDAAL